MAETFDVYHKWLGIPPKDQPPHHYRLLGIELLEADLDVISAAADQRMVFLRSFKTGKHAEAAEGLLNEISGARVCLLDPERKAAYDEQLRLRCGAAAMPAPRPISHVQISRQEVALASPAGVPGKVASKAVDVVEVLDAAPGAPIAPLANAPGKVVAPPPRVPMGRVPVTSLPELLPLADKPSPPANAVPAPPSDFARLLADLPQAFQRALLFSLKLPWLIACWLVRTADNMLLALAGRDNHILHNFLRATVPLVLLVAVGVMSYYAAAGAIQRLLADGRESGNRRSDQSPTALQPPPSVPVPLKPPIPAIEPGDGLPKRPDHGDATTVDPTSDPALETPQPDPLDQPDAAPAVGDPPPTDPIETVDVPPSDNPVDPAEPTPVEPAAPPDDIAELIRVAKAEQQARGVAAVPITHPRLGAWIAQGLVQRQSKRSWGPEQAEGPPDTQGFGDITTAWASGTADGQDEWLELGFGESISPREIHVYETYNPGALVAVMGYSETGREVLLWRGADPTRPQSGGGTSVVRVKDRGRINRIRLLLNSTSVSGWNEIDAVGIVDEEGQTHWAVAAAASSSYAGEDSPDFTLNLDALREHLGAHLSDEVLSSLQDDGRPRRPRRERKPRKD